MSSMKKTTLKIRCAIYTRKSTEEGLEMEFNTLDAQRESCEAYISSQKSEGWYLVPDYYDDGGFTGANLERPALKRLLADIETGLVNVVVVYKIDRLTRSLLDFAKLVEAFDQKKVTFASVTQSFNTTTSMGRLTLNVLLSFAQFEREISAERIRDKFAASKRKGIWMGGHVPLGYRVQDRKLIISQDDAKMVSFIFNRFLETGSPTQMVDELADVGAVGNRGNSMDTGYIYRILKNRHYLGEIPVGNESFPGEHKAIIDQKTWDQVQAMFASNTRKRHSKRRKHSDALLMGIIRCKHCDRAMTPSHSRKKGKIYRYYVCQTALKKSYDDCPLCGIPAGDIEAVVIQQVRAVLKSPEMVIKTWKEGEEVGSNIQEREVAEALQHIDPVWNELFPAEQQRLIHLLVSQVDVDSDAVNVHLQTEGIDSLAYELKDISSKMEQTV